MGADSQRAPRSYSAHGVLMPALTWSNFRGGLHLPNVSEAGEQSDFAVPENALLRADNIEFNSSGVLRGRRGRRTFGAVMAGRVVGLHRHYPRARTLIGPTEHGTNAVTLNTLGGITGGAVWFNPQGALAFTETEASTSPEFVDGQQGLFSQWLLCGGYFEAGDIPANSPIVGISVAVRRKASTGLIRDLQLRLVSGADFKGVNRAATKENWPEDFATKGYGSPSDLWGATWSSSEFDGDFYVALKVRGLFGEGGAPSCEVDAVDVVAWYLAESGEPFAVGPKLIAARNASGHRRFSTCDADATAATPSWFEHEFGAAGDPVELDETSMPRFVSWPEKSKTFIFDGINAPQFFDGEDFNVIAQAGDLAPRKGPHATLWRNRLWATDPSEADFSVYASAIQQEENWPADAQISLNDPRGGAIVGLCGLGDQLVALKETSLWAFRGDIQFGGQLVRYADQGCVAPDSVAVTPAGILYLARDGAYLTDGASGAPIEVSAPIRDLFVGRLVATVYPHAVGIYFARRQQYWLRLSPDATETWVLHRVEYDGQDGRQETLAWSRIPSLSFLCGCTFDGEAEAGDIFLGGADGLVRQADYGTSDEGSTYFVDLVTASKVLGALQLGRAYHCKPTYRGSAALTGGLRYDHDEADTIAIAGGSTLASPTVQSPRITITNQSTFGRFVNVRLSNASDGPNFELHQVTLDTMLRSAKRWP